MGVTEIDVAEKIIKVLEYIFTQLGIAFDWTVDSISPILSEAMTRYTSWKITEYTASIWIGAILIVLSIILIILVSLAVNKLNWDEDTYAWYYVLVPMLIAGIIILMINIFSLIKVSNFPELGFFEWVMSLLQN